MEEIKEPESVMIMLKICYVPCPRRLGFVDLDFECFTVCPTLLGADGNLAEAARQLGKLVEDRNQCQPNPGLRGHGTPCNTHILIYKGWPIRDA